MRIAPAIKLTPDQQSLLESQARSRSLPARLVERSHIVLLAARGQQDKEIAHTLHMSPQKVSRWRKRFLRLGLAGLEKDAPRPGQNAQDPCSPDPACGGDDHAPKAEQRYPLEHAHHGKGGGH